MIRRLICVTGLVLSLAAYPVQAGTATDSPDVDACATRTCLDHDLDAALRAVFNRKQACLETAGEGLPLPWPFPWRCPPSDDAASE